MLKILFHHHKSKAFAQKSLVLLASLMGLAVVLLALAMALPAPLHARSAHLALLVWIAGVYVLLELKVTEKKLAHVLLLGLYGHFIYISFYSGGVHSPAMSWLLVLPCTTLLLGLAATAFWLLISMACIVGFTAAEVLGLMHTQLLAPSMSAWVSGMNISMLLAVAFFVTRYEQLNRSHIQNLLNQTQTLTQVQQQLIKAQSHKDEFIAVVSHELRTPMNTVLGFSELLKDLLPSQKSKDIIEHIQQSARQLLQVISDILDFSQLKANKLSLVKESVNPRFVIEHAKQKFAEQAQQRGLEFRVSIDPNTVNHVYIDELRISEVLDQLLSNALKFTAHGHIHVSLRCEGEHVVIGVSDTGIGIDEHQLERIFAGFQHGSTEVQRRYGGTGLGLSICKQLVELHQGTMGVSSQIQQGSHFWMALPIDARLLPNPAQNTSPAESPNVVAKNWFIQHKIKLHHWLKSKQHTVLQDDDSKAYIFMVFIFLLISGTAFYSYTAPYPEAAITNALLSCVLLLGVILQVVGVRLDWIVNAILAYGCLHIVTLSLYSGGAMSITSLWLTLIPLAPLYLFDRQRVIFWLITPMLCYALLAYCTAYDLAPVPPRAAVKDALWTASNLVALTLLVLFLPFLYKMIRKHTKKSLKQQNERHKQAKQALLAEQKLKNEFIANVSHELRTPMNAIIGFNDLLFEEITHHPEAEKLNALISQSAKHLITVIDDILDYSQLESGKLAFKQEPFDVRLVIQNVYEMFKNISDAAPVTLHLDTQQVPHWVTGDRQRLMQILVNLLSNAIKFTAQGDIHLRVKHIKNGLMFEVQDTGSGIATEKIQQIFGQFEQASHTKHHRSQGHGLGLAITKRLVKAQGGSIHVRSEVGKGSSFQVWLPLTESQAPASSTPPGRMAAQSEATQLSILIVDDHPLNRLLAHQILQKTWPHAHLQEAENGAQALEKLSAHHFHLILMDMVMPDLDGVSATLQIRTHFSPPQQNIPILGLTANANLNARQQCLDAGMNDVVFKPFSRDELIASIQHLIKPQLSQAA